MPDATQSAPAAPPASQWNPDLIFAVLSEPVRRELLRSLAHEGGKPASVLRGTSRLRLDATLKHLQFMRAAGLLVTEPDPVDGRRMLYSLAPSVPVRKSRRKAW